MSYWSGKTIPSVRRLSTERVGYGNLLPSGLTRFDLRLIPVVGAPRAVNLTELRQLVEGVRLPPSAALARAARVSQATARRCATLPPRT